MDLGIPCPVSNLFVYLGPRKKTGKLRSKGLYCRWLPAPEEDIRPDNMKYTGGTPKGKRKYLEGTTGFDDPFLAGRQAVEWYKDQRKKLTELAKEIEYNSNFSLKHYFEIYFEDFQRQYVNKRNGKKRITNERSTWMAEKTGITHQSFASKSVDKISYKDLADYWRLFDEVGAVKNSDMAEAKRAVKTQINKLFRIARENLDFPMLKDLNFPTIHTFEKEEAAFLERKEYDSLLFQVSQLSGDNAQMQLTQEEFLNVPWTHRNTRNQRNYIELYDAIQMMWFFYLRAEDMPRLRTEWLSIKTNEDGEEVATLRMEQAKGMRDVKISEAYRPEAVSVVKKMLKRRKKIGYFLFDWYDRPKLNPNKSQCLETLNNLLKTACELAWIKDKKNLRWTTLRHTAFMETLKEFPHLNEVRELNIFADNAYTSADTLRKHYLNKIDRSSSAARTRKVAVEKGKVDDYVNMTLQERANLTQSQIKNGEEITDKKFLEMDKNEGTKEQFEKMQKQVTKKLHKQEKVEK